MNNRFKCKCGSTRFERVAETHDYVTFHGYIDSCGDFIEQSSGHEDCGETDWEDKVTCSECGEEYCLNNILGIRTWI